MGVRDQGVHDFPFAFLVFHPDPNINRHLKLEAITATWFFHTVKDISPMVVLEMIFPCFVFDGVASKQVDLAVSSDSAEESALRFL